MASITPDLVGVEDTKEEELIDFGGMGGQSNGLDHFLAREHDADFAYEQTVNMSAEGPDIDANDGNPLWKKMIPGNMTEGIVYEDESVKVNAKLNFTKYDGKIILELMSQGPEITNIKVSQKIPDSYKMSVSDVNMSSGTPRVMVRAIQMSPVFESPKIAFRFDVNGMQKVIHFSLPVLINKYTEKVDMNRDKFDAVWKDITHNRPSSF